MAKRTRPSLVGKVILKFVAVGRPTVNYPYIDAVSEEEGGWDTYARQRDSKAFDTVKEAKAWVDSLRSPKEMRAHCEIMGFSLTYRRVVTRKPHCAT
jgi:hypothetical protein